MKPKRGDVREDGWRFWKRSGAKDYWFSPEDYEAKAQKALESQRAHYERNKEAVKKKTKAYKEKKKPPVQKQKEPLHYDFHWSIKAIEDNIPEEDTRKPDSLRISFRINVTHLGLSLYFHPAWMARSAFMRRKDEKGCSKNLITELFLQYITEDDLKIYLTEMRSTWESDLQFTSKEMICDLIESISGLILSSLEQDDFNFYKVNPKYPDPEIKESGNLSLILRQKFVPLFDAPMSSFSDVTPPLHLRLTPPAAQDLF